MTVLLKTERILQPNGNSLSINLPAEFLNKLDWHEGDVLVLSLEEKKKGKFIAIFK